MDNREVAGVRRAITWLHEEAKTMNDPHAVQILNNAAFHLGVQLSKWRGAEPLRASFFENNYWRDGSDDAYVYYDQSSAD